ncbi:DUF262 domain-containing protein [Meridianimaribacter flavus]
MSIELKIIDDKTITLNPFKTEKADGSIVFGFKDEEGETWMSAFIENNSLIPDVISKKIIEDKEIINEKLDALYVQLIENEQSGTENSETEQVNEIQPFDPEDIKVHAKPFSLRLVSDMIEDGDIDLSPDFQRNFVWNSNQKSRLIESILLRIPLPMFYFSEDPDGRITIVDGLQRLTTIKEFMDNKFPLKNLEYLNDSCGGRYYKDDGSKKGLDKKYMRWFNQTQFSVNVIDPSSPSKVKYDIFRRINTGGKPLNNQEIRNCLAGKGLRSTLHKMTTLKEFKHATDFSIKPRRMEDQEVALRFMMFRDFYDKDENFESYSGYMDSSLNDFTEKLRNKSEEDLTGYVYYYSKAMINAQYLFGSRFAFRKVRPKDLWPNANKQLINKALFVCWSVLLSYYEPNKIKRINEEYCLLKPLANEIDNDIELLNYLSYGTNSKNNLNYALKSCEKIIDNHLKC